MFSLGTKNIMDLSLSSAHCHSFSRFFQPTSAFFLLWDIM